VGDDGVGFDPDAAFDQPGHYGLLGMRERARLAGGALTVESVPGAGTRVKIILGGHRWSSEALD
jgi:NarL family two-component system sensor histidine kinase YdfH